MHRRNKRGGRQKTVTEDGFGRSLFLRGVAKNKLPVWAYMKETIRKKKARGPQDVMRMVSFIKGQTPTGGLDLRICNKTAGIVAKTQLFSHCHQSAIFVAV